MSNTKKIYEVRVDVGDQMHNARRLENEAVDIQINANEVIKESDKTFSVRYGGNDWKHHFRKSGLDVIKPGVLHENTTFSFFTDDESKIETLVLKGLGLAALRARGQFKKSERELADVEKAIDSILKAD